MRALLRHAMPMIAVALLSVAALAACDEEGPAERTGEAVDEAAEEAGEEVEDATDD